MKRLVAVALALLCTLLVQFPLAVTAAPVATPCACCGGGAADGCGRPDCVVPPAPTIVFSIEETALTAAPLAKGQSEIVQCGTIEKFYAAFVRTVVPAPPRLRFAARPAREPLFKAHCSFLI